MRPQNWYGGACGGWRVPKVCCTIPRQMSIFERDPQRYESMDTPKEPKGKIFIFCKTPSSFFHIAVKESRNKAQESRLAGSIPTSSMRSKKRAALGGRRPKTEAGTGRADLRPDPKAKNAIIEDVFGR